MKVLIVISLVLASWVSASATELRFCTQDFPPYSYRIDEVITGPAVEIVKAVCLEAGIQCYFDMLPWGRSQDYVKSGKADGLFLLGKNRERESWLYFSDPVIKGEYGFFVNNLNSLTYTSPKDISGYTVAVYGPSNTATRLKFIADQMNTCTVEIRPDDESGFKKLGRKRVDAVFSNKDVGYAMIHKLKINNIRYAGTEGYVFYYVGFPKLYISVETVRKFNESYKRLYDRGDVARILNSYFMKPVSIQQNQHE